MPLPQPYQLDCARWLTGIGRFAIEVKGGRYPLEREPDRWRLHTRHGTETKASPLDQATVAAHDLRRVPTRSATRSGRQPRAPPTAARRSGPNMLNPLLPKGHAIAVAAQFRPHPRVRCIIRIVK